ncbi:MAG: penicillin-binding transpeptidase domain-containing protein [Smithella sp.]
MKFFNEKKKISEKMTWREYQKHINRQSKHKRHKNGNLLKLTPILLIVMVAIGYGLMQRPAPPVLPAQLPKIEQAAQPVPGVSKVKSNLLGSLDGKNFLNLREPVFTTQIEGRDYRVETSIDHKLQESLLAKVKEMMGKERYLSRSIGIVVMTADTGRILSMVSFDRQNPMHNTCVDGQFPAASIFKIITAAAAIDTQGLTENSSMSFNGQKHTLYRGQLKEAAKRYSHSLSLKDSFAQSVNPVFGKLGSQVLGKEKIEDYAIRFGFNKPINFDIIVEQSRLATGDDPFRLAEIASGYNTETTISPLHGAMIASTVLNNGNMINPSVIDRIIGPDNRVVYERRNQHPQRVISENTSRELHRMMQATVSNGTAHKVFKYLNRNAVLKDLNVGGKTGSINNNPRYDWFIGFAENPRTGQAIIVSAVVAHGQFIGEKAGQYAKLAMETFFSKNMAIAATPGNSLHSEATINNKPASG